jgi:hypothetical protein
MGARIQLTLGTLAVVLLGFIPPCAGAEPLPTPILQALQSTEPGFVARIQWSSLRNHPVMETAFDDKADLDASETGPAASLIHSALSSLERLQLAPSLIDEAWLASGDSMGGIWLRPSVGGDLLAASLRAGEWELDPSVSEVPVWVHDADPHTKAWQEGVLEGIDNDDQEIAEMRADFAASRPRLVQCDSDWLVAFPYGVQGSELEDLCGGSGTETVDVVPVFPREVLLEQAPEVLISVALDLPGNDHATATADEEGDDAEREALVTELRRLQGSDLDIVGQLGDMSIVISELDGALAVDLVARRDDGGGADETARFLNMMLLGARFAIAPSAPDLDRALADARIEVVGPEVHGRCVLSQATLIDTLEADRHRRAEIDELQRQLEDLEGTE